MQNHFNHPFVYHAILNIENKVDFIVSFVVNTYTVPFVLYSCSPFPTPMSGIVSNIQEKTVLTS